jgi:hypothetical protein
MGKNPFVEFMEKKSKKDYIVNEWYGNTKEELNFVNTSYDEINPRAFEKAGVIVGKDDNKFWIDLPISATIHIGSGVFINVKTEIKNISNKKNDPRIFEKLTLNEKPFITYNVEGGTYTKEKTGYIGTITFGKSTHVIVGNNEKGKIVEKIITKTIPKYIVNIQGIKKYVREDDMVHDMRFIIGIGDR